LGRALRHRPGRSAPAVEITELLTKLYDGKPRLERRNGASTIYARTFLQGKLIHKSTGERTLHAAHAGFLRYVGEPLRRGCAQQGGDLKEDADGVEQNGGPMVGCPA
jgi:hypothetical protein